MIFSVVHPTFRRGDSVYLQKKGAMRVGLLQPLGYLIGGLVRNNKHSNHYLHQMTRRTRRILFWSPWLQALP